MDFEVVTHPEAQEDLSEALEWLQERTLWSANELLNDYDKQVEQIRQSPASHHFIYQEFRRANLKRFQYHVIYRANINTLFIIAFAHAKRHPDYWKSRIPEEPA